MNRKEICRSKYDTNKIKWTDRVKGKLDIKSVGSAQGRELCKKKLATILQNTNDKRVQN